MGNLYDKSAYLYDEGTNSKLSKEDINFYLQKISINDSVLEVGCGTGRVAIELAKRGNQVTAIDLSSKMLDLFNEKIESSPYQDMIDIQKMDMTNIDLEKKFDWIIFPFRVFQALINNEQRNECLKGIKNHLNNNGKAIIQIFNPNLDFFENWEELNSLDYEFYSKEFQSKMKRYIIGEKHNQKEQTIQFQYKFTNSKVEIVEPMILGYLFHQQAVELFENNELQIKEMYSDWKQNPIKDNEKKELIYVLTKNKF